MSNTKGSTQIQLATKSISLRSKILLCIWITLVLMATMILYTPFDGIPEETQTKVVTIEQRIRDKVLPYLYDSGPSALRPWPALR